jgi:hypothetical protein
MAIEASKYDQYCATKYAASTPSQIHLAWLGIKVWAMRAV